MKKIIFAIYCLFITLTNNAQSELWGVTLYGGQNDMGVIYRYDNINNSINVEYSFDATDGYDPRGSLLYASDGNLYGFTDLGGIYNHGVMFKYNPNIHTYTKIKDFDQSDPGFGMVGLIEYTDGKFYGTTSRGGLYDAGVIVQYDPITSIFSKKIDSNCEPGGLMIAFDGMMYSIGHFCNIFKYNPINNSVTYFNYNPDPLCGYGHSGLMQATDGTFYGTNHYGNGNSMYGGLFKYDIANNNYQCIQSFGNQTFGSRPRPPVQASNGKLYGTALVGVYSDGLIYECSNSIFSIKQNFQNATTGSFPYNPTQLPNGNLYGTANGGSNNMGVIYEYNIVTDSLIKKIDFNGLNGRSPSGGLTVVNKAQKDICLYPNPNNGSFTIDLPSKSQIIITNLLGEIVLNQSMEKGNHNLSIQSQTAGVYFVKVINTKGISISKKIIKQ